ncbi:Bardet-Biedl syndrome 4 [Carabus blaptoides fortunei]
MSIITNGKQGMSISSKAANPSKNVVFTEPPPIEKLNWLIHLTHARGDIVNCKNLINEEIKRSSGRNEYAYYQKGIILKEENKIQEALEAFQICHKLNPKNVENIKQVASCLFLLRRHKLALEAYLEAEKASDKPDWEICHKLGECLLKLGELSNAKDYARRSVQLGKQELSYALLIKVLVADNDLRSAVAVSNAALENCPDSTDMLNESGILYLRTGQIQHAFERLSSVLALEPNCVKALLGVGSIIQSHEEFDVALSKYKMAVSQQTNSVPLWNNIGMCYYGKQKYIAAISCLKRALWHSPLNWRVLYNLGLVHLTTKQPASAFNFLCAAVNLRPDNGYAFMLLGCALLDLDDVENASRAMKQAVVLTSQDPTVLVNATLCLHLVGDTQKAADVYQMYRALDADNQLYSTELKEFGAQLARLFPEDMFTTPTSEVGAGNESTEAALKEGSSRHLATDEV